MKDFHRDNPLFALCGLNCGLCQLYVGGYCPGCGGGDGNQSCAIARCSRAHGDVPYCFQCGEYPCARYEGRDAYDSFLPVRTRQRDVALAKRIGVPAYTELLREKMDILRRFLDGYNDGRRKSLFLIAAYLLDSADLQKALLELPGPDVPIGERAAAAADMLNAIAAQRGVELKLHKKPKKP